MANMPSKRLLESQPWLTCLADLSFLRQLKLNPSNVTDYSRRPPSMSVNQDLTDSQLIWLGDLSRPTIQKRELFVPLVWRVRRLVRYLYGLSRRGRRVFRKGDVTVGTLCLPDDLSQSLARPCDLTLCVNSIVCSSCRTRQYRE